MLYSAPNLQYMMDSPYRAFRLIKKPSWDVVNTDGKSEKRINLTVHSDDDQPAIDNFGKMVQKMVLEEKSGIRRVAGV